MRATILLVEDDENKRSQLLQMLSEQMSDAEVITAASFQAGLRRLREEHVTFVVLDMSLPNYDIGPEENGGEMRQLGGKDFLRRMVREGRRIPTVIVTQYETFGFGRDRVDLSGLRVELEAVYSGVCLGVIYYNSALDNWKQELKELLVQAHSGENV